ncbi:MAG: MBL fold metallo-hydrolase [Sphingomonadaceae bacterium]
MAEAPRPRRRRPRRADERPADAVRMRLYCHGLGDCLLIDLPTSDGQPFWMLIDCGIHSSEAGGADRVRAVVDDIAALTGGRLDLVVGTHEHWDHLSGFLQAPAFTDGRLRVGAVWLSWAENPADPLAAALDRYKADMAATVMGMRIAMDGAFGMEAVAQGIDALMGFQFGARGERVRSAREALKALAPVTYLEPGTLAPLPARVAGVRVHVLGPPRDRALLNLHDDPGNAWGLALGAHPDSLPFASALAIGEGRLTRADDPAAPFDEGQGLSFEAVRGGDWAAVPDALRTLLWAHYFNAGEARRIDEAWLGPAADLALQLDRNTNNTSLVLAIELVASGRVLLFAADAQAGNWRSWDEVVVPLPGGGQVTGPELVARTVFYKVGHHGSGNATRRAGGLEAMDARDLVAFNPTNEARARTLGWLNFPAPALTARLGERTAGRYIQSDAGWIADPGVPVPVQVGGALRHIERSPGPSVTLVVG